MSSLSASKRVPSTIRKKHFIGVDSGGKIQGWVWHGGPPSVPRCTISIILKSGTTAFILMQITFSQIICCDRLRLEPTYTTTSIVPTLLIDTTHSIVCHSIVHLSLSLSLFYRIQCTPPHSFSLFSLASNLSLFPSLTQHIQFYIILFHTSSFSLLTVTVSVSLSLL